MRLIVLAAGRLRPPFTDDVAHYERLLRRQARVEVVEVREDEALARRIGINGVPFFVLDRRLGVSGAQAPEVLLGALRQAYEERDATRAPA